MDTRFEEALQRKNLVFVMGTGVSAALTDGADNSTWRGLLESGIELAAKVGAKPEWVQLVRKNIEVGFDGDYMGFILAAASLVDAELRKDNPYTYAKWLQDTVGQLKVSDSDEAQALLESLHALPFPLLTTNYDTLIETSGRPPAVWTNPVGIQELLAGGNAVGHLHGLWSEPDSVVLSESSYQRVRASEAAQTLQKAVSSIKSIVYVGYGAGLSDPNFGTLISWHRQQFVPSAVPHFRLCLNSQVEKLEGIHAGDQIIPVGYGDSHAELQPFLDGLTGKLGAVVLSTGGIVRDLVGEAQRSFSDDLKRDSLITDLMPDADACALEDVVAPPVLLPVSQSNYVRAKALKDAPNHKRLDPIAELEQGEVLVLASEENNGLTTALKWLALEASTRRGPAVPLHISFLDCRKGQHPLADAVRRQTQLRGFGANRKTPLPPYVLALDNYSPHVPPMSDRVIEDLAALQPNFAVIGCNQGSEEEVVKRLTQAGVKHRVRYLGRLTAADVRHFAKLAMPKKADDLAQQLLDVLANENLPRTPYTVGLLISVMVHGGALTKNASQTSVLDDYIGMLLGRGDPQEDARFGLEQNNREALLAGFAKALVELDKGGLPEDKTVTNFATSFKGYGWDESPTELLEYFLSRRILKRAGEHIAFSRSSYLHLFAAKRSITDSKFRDHLLTNAIRFAPALSDYAALNRHDRDLVEAVGKLLEPGRWELSSGPMFDELPPETPEELEEAGRKSALTPAAPSKSSEDQLFDSRDDVDDALPFPIIDEVDVPLPLQLTRTLELVSNVLRDSDQIEDLELKEEVLDRVLVHWGVLMSLMHADADFRDFLRSILDEIKPKNDELLDELLMAIPAAVTLAGVSYTLASRKLIVVLNNLLAKPQGAQAQERVATAAFFIYGLREPGWIGRLRELFKTGGNTWVVRHFLLGVLLREFVFDEIADEGERDQLLELCLDIRQLPTNFDSSRAAASYRDRMKTYYISERRTVRQMNKANQPKAIESKPATPS